MEWDLKELRELCKNKGITPPDEYIESLAFKKHRAIYHADKSKQIISQYFDDYGPMINMNNETHMRGLDRAWFEATCEAEASLQSMHSMADILAQIINSVLIKKPLVEKEVTLRKIFKKLTEQIIWNKLYDKIQTFIGSDEFTYIDAFVNTIKHRKLIKSGFRAEGGINTRNDHGVTIQGFKYNDKMFDTKWVKDLFDNYYIKIFSMIVEIGTEINVCLK